jgi:hypothetical protein
MEKYPNLTYDFERTGGYDEDIFEYELTVRDGDDNDDGGSTGGD